MMIPIALLLLAPSADMVAAEANTPLVKTFPIAKDMPEPPYPDAEREAGHNGRVTVFGIVGVDGRYREVVVRDSSGSPVLDTLALEAARQGLYRPGKDKHGKPIACRRGRVCLLARIASSNRGTA